MSILKPFWLQKACSACCNGQVTLSKVVNSVWLSKQQTGVVQQTPLDSASSVGRRCIHHTRRHDFQPKKVLLLRKVTRYEYEKAQDPDISDAELKERLISKGSNYDGLLQRHDEYFRSIDEIQESLIKHHMEYELIRRFDFDRDLIKWADMILTAGGDGTFLMAASKVTNGNKPVVGINTDPMRSEGHLCLPKQYSYNVDLALQKILDDKFQWLWRQRIRIALAGRSPSDYEPFDLLQQQLDFPEYRYWEHVREHEIHNIDQENVSPLRKEVLPVLALNEVFMGESLSSRMSFYEVCFDDGPVSKQKSSGITVCTGTGSTSWFFNINHISQDSVSQVLKIAQEHGACGSACLDDDHLLNRVREEFNTSLVFNPVCPQMAYSVRDPVSYGIYQVASPKGFCSKVEVRSRMWDAWVVVDGSLSYRFNDGAIAELSVHREDALRCISLLEDDQ
ncbi:hypothetical protein CAPTEDRAFT_170107 [Capitella teleta]|uniref:NAD(+) kinase n=1 Tax=Capitella teleta TaxID=283909 RepID=R7VDH8_CAPTE|nr:hypothetical protein CAPTEDRAFT_170107 [Capitella teleta]|eukprot:ELU16622.1 hypothetical protein CAPTEDRAFT_170107 [Capitella teleta]